MKLSSPSSQEIDWNFLNPFLLKVPFHRDVHFQYFHFVCGCRHVLAEQNDAVHADDTYEHAVHIYTNCALIQAILNKTPNCSFRIFQIICSFAINIDLNVDVRMSPKMFMHILIAAFLSITRC